MPSPITPIFLLIVLFPAFKPFVFAGAPPLDLPPLFGAPYSTGNRRDGTFVNMLSRTHNSARVLLHVLFDLSA